MYKAKHSEGKLSPVTILSLGFMVLGIGCVSWAMLSMWAQSYYFADAYNSSSFISTTFAAEPNKLMVGSTVVPEKPDSSLVLPALDKTLYPVYLAEGYNIGSLTIPALKRKLPILQGTGVKELKKGVGHFAQSVLPGEEDNCVLSGHRDTVFSKLDKLKIGDQLIVQTSAGSFTYEVSGTRIVDKDDRTVIVPTDNAVLTMTTCYPFHFIGSAPDRYIVTADLVK